MWLIYLNSYNMNKITIILSGLFIISPIIMECENNDDIFLETEGYIVGFDPCTINNEYRIGYVIVSENLNDTLVTYNLSDESFTMPASIICGKDTLYTIPQSHFQNYPFSAYFPASTRYDYKIKVTYQKSSQDELVFYLCSHNINLSDFFYQIENNQVVIKSASIY